MCVKGGARGWEAEGGVRAKGHAPCRPCVPLRPTANTPLCVHNPYSFPHHPLRSDTESFMGSVPNSPWPPASPLPRGFSGQHPVLGGPAWWAMAQAAAGEGGWGGLVNAVNAVNACICPWAMAMGFLAGAWLV